MSRTPASGAPATTSSRPGTRRPVPRRADDTAAPAPGRAAQPAVDPAAVPDALPSLPPGGVLAHEWIEPHGGAEKVLDELAVLLPDADILCLWDDDPARYPGHRVVESWLARSSLRGRKALALPFMSRAWRTRDVSGYDWALVSSYSFAHHLAVGGRRARRSFVYAHSPARYLWAPEADPRGRSLSTRVASPYLRGLDRRQAQRGQVYAANSAYVAERIERAWGLTSTVVHPPVDVERLSRVGSWADELDEVDRTLVEALPETFLLAASRLVPYKAVDRAIEVAAATGLPLVVAGAGPDRTRLEQLALASRVQAIFLGRVGDALLYTLYQRALAYLFLAVEDFGIMPVEAMAAGARVVANEVGGTAESVAGRGQVAPVADLAALVAAVEAVESAPPVDVVDLERRFGRSRFRAEVATWVGSHA